MRSNPAAIVLIFATSLYAQIAPKPGAVIYSAQSRANAVANAKSYDWAKQQTDEAIAAAQPFVDMDDDELYEIVIPPKLKRAIMVNVNKGCPKCGMAMYGSRGPRPYAWIGTVNGQPWKVQCPNCSEVFPKNDFGKFYESGIDPATGLYEPARADRSLLFNVDHPDPNDPEHKWCVDDGEGAIRDSSQLVERDFFVAYHVYHSRCARVTAAIRTLAKAYSLTGKLIYGHKCAILMDRMADVYADYDGGSSQLFNNVWGRYSDGILGPNYWAGGGWAQQAINYDMIYDAFDQSPETLAFIQRKAEQYKTPLPKKSIADVRRNIEVRVLYENTQPKNYKRIHMNGSITEMCLAKVDLVLRGDAAKREFVTKHIPGIVPSQYLNNDGSGNERSTGYDSNAFGSYSALVEQLYQLDRDLVQQIVDGYPKLAAAFDFWADVWCLENYIPLIGDVGEAGSTTPLCGTPGAYLAMFDVTNNPRYAQVALRMVGHDIAKLPRDIYAKDPQGVVDRAIQSAEKTGDWRSSSTHKPDYQLAILREGKGDDRLALWMFYSPKGGTSSHSHLDAMTFGLYAFGQSVVCEQGYPQYTGGWPARWQWTSNTRSHATVTVDGESQIHCDGGQLLGYESKPGVMQFVSAQAPCAYPQVSRYRRTMVLVPMENERSCIVDVFRVTGGKTHAYTVPLFYGDVTVSGVELAPREDMYGAYIESVRAGKPAGQWYADATVRTAWEGAEAGHLRIHGLTNNITVMIGQGETRYAKDVPKRLPYLIALRESKDEPLDSTFVVVYELYRDQPWLDSGTISATANADQVVVTCGQRDIVIQDNLPMGTQVSIEKSPVVTGKHGP